MSQLNALFRLDGLPSVRRDGLSLSLSASPLELRLCTMPSQALSVCHPLPLLTSIAFSLTGRQTRQHPEGEHENGSSRLVMKVALIQDEIFRSWRMPQVAVDVLRTAIESASKRHGKRQHRDMTEHECLASSHDRLVLTHLTLQS